MNKAFEKILERLEEKAIPVLDEDEHIIPENNIREPYEVEIVVLSDAKKIVQEVAEEYNNGWIPISDRFPENDKYILLSFDNFSMPMIGRYESYESGGAFYIGDEDITCSKQDLFVNAWQPLPEPYQPKGE